MTIKLHVFPLSPARLQGVVRRKPTRHRLTKWCCVNFAKQDQKTPGFTALNPNQRMPVLEDDGFVLWESNAIVQYLASLKPQSGLLPADLKSRMTAVKWQFWESRSFRPACAIFMFERVVKPLFGRGEASESEIKRGEELMARLCPDPRCGLAEDPLRRRRRADRCRHLARRRRSSRPTRPRCRSSPIAAFSAGVPNSPRFPAGRRLWRSCVRRPDASA